MIVTVQDLEAQVAAWEAVPKYFLWKRDRELRRAWYLAFFWRDQFGLRSTTWAEAQSDEYCAGMAILQRLPQ